MSRKWYKAAAAVMIAAVLAAGCGGGSQNEAETSAPKGTTFTSLDGNMQLTLPDSWRQDEESSQRARFAAHHESKDRFVIVKRTAKADLKDGTTVDDIVNQTINISDTITMDDMEMLEIRDITVGSDAAKQIEFRGIDKNATKEKLRFLITTLEKGDYFYQLLFCAKEYKFDRYKDEFEKGIQSFKAISPSAAQAEAIDPEKPSVFQSADKRMELTLTSNWMVYPMNPDAEISAYYPAEKEFVIVIPDAREEMGEIETLEDYYDLVYELNFSEFMPGGPVEEPRNVEINGLSALQFEIQGVTEDKEKIAILITLIESPQQFTQVIFWTTQSKIEQKRERFIEAVASYKEHDA
ncbi:pilus assembly protein PilA [Paenibacillus dendritiformis]|jgi:hypothetical protein|uniref:PsbP-related protein n=1 Tax=Paenibacillus dendritiformis TaxID=130049 RepID=UPI001059758A|nr:pilus assembly protein PilA [Paenibacillus dendritiformis]TDL47827.1 pilus assembly protein PilA [Paenibacillus dendritiformis]